MRTDVQIQHGELHPRWRNMIDRQVLKLTQLHERVVRLRVTLIHSTHHGGGAEEVRLLLTLPRRILRVHKTRAAMGDAIRAAFVALHEELQRRKERRRPF